MEWRVSLNNMEEGICCWIGATTRVEDALVSRHTHPHEVVRKVFAATLDVLASSPLSCRLSAPQGSLGLLARAPGIENAGTGSVLGSP
eukprot:3352246-Amphidinium_carterae.1